VAACGGQGRGAEVRVCDRGPGVPEAYRERIFEPFFRLPGHAEREGGVGLGLALVRQIAQRHGGRALRAARRRRQLLRAGLPLLHSRRRWPGSGRFCAR
jgi:signal transduction histidine kinase